MRSLAVVTIVMLALVAMLSARTASAMQAPPQPSQPAIIAQQVDDNDDTRVDVQLVVAGITAIIVVGFGSLAYAIRWKLGRTKYDREAAEKALGHH